MEEDYKEQIKELEQKALDWENASIAEKRAKKKLEDEYKIKLKTTEQERDEWKNEAHAASKVYQTEKKTKEQTDFLSELAKLQEKKGININEKE